MQTIRYEGNFDDQSHNCDAKTFGKNVLKNIDIKMILNTSLNVPGYKFALNLARFCIEFAQICIDFATISMMCTYFVRWSQNAASMRTP